MSLLLLLTTPSSTSRYFLRLFSSSPRPLRTRCESTKRLSFGIGVCQSGESARGQRHASPSRTASPLGGGGGAALGLLGAGASATGVSAARGSGRLWSGSSLRGA